ncbi:Probable adenosine monophosphate-protein transferase fic [Bordetella ansorpii]|uniref:protein adenylyltransferase n=1 Tax=Bordetella ansorpii TaxID=288768 RepID=A0A157SRK7_9BORD|nr:Fic family protein [Bordetella ansorpii]SAI73138.1 Probable adenosine monophosphate-protein transferase fic [Bordetella ansorpii]
MAKYTADDAYSDPETGVLINRLGIRDEALLAKIEATYAMLRATELARQPLSGSFDLAHLQAIHKKLFGDVYDWAGQIRTVDIAKGRTQFASVHHIERYAPQITGPLARENYLRGLDADTFSRRAAHYLGELNVLHPFREGNGRTLRAFTSQLAQQAGYHIAWSGISRADMTEASIQAYHAGSELLAELIRANVRDVAYEQAVDLARTGGQETFVARAQPGQTYLGAVIGQTDTYLVQAVRDAPQTVVVHRRRALLDSEPLKPGATVEIRYPHGDVGLVRLASDGLERQGDAPHEHQRQADRDLER